MTCQKPRFLTHLAILIPRNPNGTKNQICWKNPAVVVLNDVGTSLGPLPIAVTTNSGKRLDWGLSVTSSAYRHPRCHPSFSHSLIDVKFRAYTSPGISRVTPQHGPASSFQNISLCEWYVSVTFASTFQAVGTTSAKNNSSRSLVTVKDSHSVIVISLADCSTETQPTALSLVGPGNTQHCSI